MKKKRCPECGSVLQDTDPGNEIVVFYCPHCNTYNCEDDLDLD